MNITKNFDKFELRIYKSLSEFVKNTFQINDEDIDGFMQNSIFEFSVDDMTDINNFGRNEKRKGIKINVKKKEVVG